MSKYFKLKFGILQEDFIPSLFRLIFDKIVCGKRILFLLVQRQGLQCNLNFPKSL